VQVAMLCPGSPHALHKLVFLVCNSIPAGIQPFLRPLVLDLGGLSKTNSLDAATPPSSTMSDVPSPDDFLFGIVDLSGTLVANCATAIAGGCPLAANSGLGNSVLPRNADH
jgi:hypothetical protein